MAVLLGYTDKVGVSACRWRVILILKTYLAGGLRTRIRLDPHLLADAAGVVDDGAIGEVTEG